ncbi:hypothetical protein GCM10010327_66050 [Streptomyces nitrosporeus]|nr:hypothetical protein GCM10010327_66050 [Streptomyces nitrosporeus]
MLNTLPMLPYQGRPEAGTGGLPPVGVRTRDRRRGRRDRYGDPPRGPLPVRLPAVRTHRTESAVRIPPAQASSPRSGNTARRVARTAWSSRSAGS